MKTTIVIIVLLGILNVVIFSYCINRDCFKGDNCPGCGQDKCIYVDIDKVYDEGKEISIEQAIKIVTSQRKITDTNTIEIITANY